MILALLFDRGRQKTKRKTSQQDIGRWYEEFKKPLFLTAFVVTKDTDLAKDAVQNVFCTLLEKNDAEKMPEIQFPRSYLQTSVRREALSLFYSNKHLKEKDRIAFNILNDRDKDRAQFLALVEEFKKVDIKKILTVKEHQVIELLMNDCKPLEVAEKLKIKTGYVYKLSFSAKRKLINFKSR